MVFTYLPALARGTGLSVGVLGTIIFARDLTGLLGPRLAGTVRKWGPWRTMTGAGALAAIGMFLAVLGPIGIAVGLVLWGLGRTAYLLAINSWLGEVVAYERRGRAIGLVELTWAGAALVGLPIMGLLIGTFGWWAAPLALSLVGAPAALWARLAGAPEARPKADEVPTALPVQRTTIVALAAIAAMTGSAQFLFFTHGLWLEATYGFDPGDIAAAIIVVGAAEAVASFATSRITDLIGKRVAVLAGSTVMALVLGLLAVFPAPPLGWGIGMLLTAFLGFEFAIVSSIPLTTELEPENRSAVIGLGIGLSTVARALVSLAAGFVYVGWGFRFTMVLAAGLAVMSVVVITARVREPVPG